MKTSFLISFISFLIFQVTFASSAVPGNLEQARDAFAKADIGTFSDLSLGKMWKCFTFDNESADLPQLEYEHFQFILDGNKVRMINNYNEGEVKSSPKDLKVEMRRRATYFRVNRWGDLLIETTRDQYYSSENKPNAISDNSRFFMEYYFCGKLDLTENNQFASDYLNSLGLHHLNIIMPNDEIFYQSQMLENKVDFKAALKEAIHSFLYDAEDCESPLSLVMDNVNCEDVGYAKGCDDFAPEIAQKRALKAREILINYLNDSKSSIRLMNHYEEAEGGEEVRDSWIFSLDIENLSDHGHWAVIDRKGIEATYNYGFN